MFINTGLSHKSKTQQHTDCYGDNLSHLDPVLSSKPAPLLAKIAGSVLIFYPLIFSLLCCNIKNFKLLFMQTFELHFFAWIDTL